MHRATALVTSSNRMSKGIGEFATSGNPPISVRTSTTAHVAQRAVGEFFKWASSSDWCAPTFLERCWVELQEQPDAVLAVPRTRLFEGSPDRSRVYESDIEVIDETPSARLRTVMTTMALNNAINGLIRMSALRQTRLIEPYRGSDLVLMAHLALLGKFRLIDDALYFRRMEPSYLDCASGPVGGLEASLSAAKRGNAPARKQAPPRSVARRIVGADGHDRAHPHIGVPREGPQLGSRNAGGRSAWGVALPEPSNLAWSSRLIPESYRAGSRAQ